MIHFYTAGAREGTGISLPTELGDGQRKETKTNQTPQGNKPKPRRMLPKPRPQHYYQGRSHRPTPASCPAQLCGGSRRLHCSLLFGTCHLLPVWHQHKEPLDPAWQQHRPRTAARVSELAPKVKAGQHGGARACPCARRSRTACKHVSRPCPASHPGSRAQRACRGGVGGPRHPGTQPLCPLHAERGP